MRLLLSHTPAQPQVAIQLLAWCNNKPAHAGRLGRTCSWAGVWAHCTWSQIVCDQHHLWTACPSHCLSEPQSSLRQSRYNLPAQQLPFIVTLHNSMKATHHAGGAGWLQAEGSG